MTTAEGVVTEALATEMELILALASSLTKQSNPVGDARQMIADTARIVLAALSDAGFAVVELPSPDERGMWSVEDTDLEVCVKHERSTNPGQPGIEFRVYNSVRGSTLAKSYEASVAPEFAACLLAAFAAASKAAS